MAALPAADRPAVLAELRARIAAPRVLGGQLPTGLSELDAWMGGWPQPGISEIVGPVGSGRLGLILPTLAALTRQGRPVLVVDAMGALHPPGLAGPGGVQLEALWMVRPGLERAAWVAEQAAAAGSLAAVLLLDAPRLGRAAVRLGRACERGGSALFVVAEESEAALPAALRLEVHGHTGAQVRVSCVRSRHGRQVGERHVRLAQPG
jgi:RecA/RadA recombinase